MAGGEVFALGAAHGSAAQVQLVGAQGHTTGARSTTRPAMTQVEKVVGSVGEGEWGNDPEDVQELSPRKHFKVQMDK